MPHAFVFIRMGFAVTRPCGRRGGGLSVGGVIGHLAATAQVAQVTDHSTVQHRHRHRRMERGRCWRLCPWHRSQHPA